MAKHDEEIACPVCGRPVGLDVASCPYCGAEFEAEEEAAPAAVEAVSADEEEVSCPVCSKVVGLEVTTCPHCGAEFEEEEVEEVIEVEEKPIEALTRTEEEAKEPAGVRARKIAAEEEEVEVTEEVSAPASITDLRVIGVSLILLGILGSQISVLIDWYWTWVPPIGDNLAMFIMIPAVILIVGLVTFMLVKKYIAKGKRMPRMMPGLSLSLFLFGIFALVVMLLWDPINTALQDSQALVAAGFFAAFAVGILLMFIGMRQAAKASAS
jgi:RNA polymerase subunit RPABC4/transcription elongation factor Spt4